VIERERESENEKQLFLVQSKQREEIDSDEMKGDSTRDDDEEGESK
jgi:hypothetical protein